jgi:2-polyprenyl-3-methyl-5-hydroxy-6-metoxy-1,4-benzoquinol methylase
VLNAGCGAGSFTLRLLDAGYDVTSVDASEAFVERVRQLVGDRGAVELADLHALRFEAGTFDAIVCGEVLGYTAAGLAERITAAGFATST